MEHLRPLFYSFILLLMASFGYGATLSIVATQDRTVRDDDVYTGSDDFLLMGDHSQSGIQTFSTFLAFDLTNPDLTGATINSATFRLTSIASAGDGTSVDINLFELSAANSVWDEDTITYDQRVDGTTDWAGGEKLNAFVPGTDFVDTVLGSYSGATNDGSGGDLFDLGNASLATSATGAIGGNLNLVILNDPIAGNASKQFLRIASSENATEAWRPQLILDYTVIPEPSSLLLLSGAIVSLVLFRRRR